jgi:hypothetical protein
MKKIILFLFLVSLFASCKKDEAAAPVEPDWAGNVQGIYTVTTKSAGYVSISGTHDITVTITKTTNKKVKLVWTDSYKLSGNISGVETFEVSNTTFTDETTITFDDIAKWENSNSKFTGKGVFLGKNLQLTYKTVEPGGSYDSTYLLVKN